MSEEQITTEITTSTPESGNDVAAEQVLEALAEGHDQQDDRIGDLETRLADKDNELAELRAQLAELQTIVESQDARTDLESAKNGNIEEKERKPDSILDIERLATITGRSIDDPELIKLHLRLKLDQFKQLTRAYDDQEGTVRQKGFMQDVATAKRELEEAMYLYDPRFAEMRAKESRIKARLKRATNLEEKSRLRNELFRLKDHGNVDGHGEPRREMADELTDRLDGIAGSLDGSEILATYELHQGEVPAEPISNRRHVDTLDWRSKPEYDENGIYIGSSPARNGEWVLEPKPPLESISSSEGTGPEGAGEGEGTGPEGEGEGEGTGPEGEGEGTGPEGEGEGTGPEGEGEGEGTGPEGEGEGTGPEGEGTGEQNSRNILEVPPINPGDYPELYARRKNLVGGDLEALKSESERIAQELTANVEALVNNFIVENPDATAEQIRQFSLQCYIEAQNDLQKDIIAAIDGRGYVDANGIEKGNSRLRRFGSWLDKHGSKIKKGMLIVGAAGAVVLTIGITAGAIVPAFAIGAGTAVGAIQGASTGLGMSRHGSKESASRSIDLSNESYQQMFTEMTPAEVASYARLSEYMMSQYDESAEKDHSLNIKKSRRAAIIGAVIGGLAGSLSFDSLQTSDTSQTIDVPNKPPEIPHHTIESGELTGQVIDKTLNQMGIDASEFVNPDNSTNLQAIYDIIPRSQWQSMEELANGTHSIAGADNLSNEGIRHIVQTIVNNHDWGTHAETIGSTTTQLVPNLPATIGGYVTGAILAAGLARQGAESARQTAGFPETARTSSVESSGDSRSTNLDLQDNQVYNLRANGRNQQVRFMGRGPSNEYRFVDPNDSSQTVTYTQQQIDQLQIQPATA